MLSKNDSICECKSSYVTVSDCDCGSTALPCNSKCNVSPTVRDIVTVSLPDTEIRTSEGMIHVIDVNDEGPRTKHDIHTVYWLMYLNNA